jgi:hypothetical protein
MTIHLGRSSAAKFSTNRAVARLWWFMRRLPRAMVWFVHSGDASSRWIRPRSPIAPGVVFRVIFRRNARAFGKFLA